MMPCPRHRPAPAIFDVWPDWLATCSAHLTRPPHTEGPRPSETAGQCRQMERSSHGPPTPACRLLREKYSGVSIRPPLALCQTNRRDWLTRLDPTLIWPWTASSSLFRFSACAMNTRPVPRMKPRCGRNVHVRPCLTHIQEIWVSYKCQTMVQMDRPEDTMAQFYITH